MKQIEMFHFLAAERRYYEREQLAVMIADRLGATLAPLVALAMRR